MLKRHAPSTSQTVTTTVVKKAKQAAKPKTSFGIPRWAGKTKVGFPKELRMKHWYVETLTLASTTGTPGFYLFRCNGMFDPNHTGTGHQPLYFDQLTAIYDHFNVRNSKITLRAAVPSTNSTPVCAGIFINDDTTTTPSNAQNCCELSSAVYRVMGSKDCPEVVFTKKWSANEAFGPASLNDPELQGSASADPTEQQLYTIFVQSIDGSTTNRIDWTVTIEYDAIWTELKDIASS